MTALTRLALFAVAVVLTFAGAFAVGATVGPDRSDGQSPGPGLEQGVEEEMGHGDS